MTDRMVPLSIEQLYLYTFKELDKFDTIFGIHRESFFRPERYPEQAFRRYGQLLDNPTGVAAGPQTQLAQNIIAAWLAGARYLELKTVQTLDELEVSKPCIDAEDEGFNCEWSQELKLHDSFQEYLNAWIMIHILREELNLKGPQHSDDAADLGTIFNMSVGYNLEGIMQENVQTFFRRMRDCSEEMELAIARLRPHYKKMDQLAPKISRRLTNNITLSTMHGCPPHEIEKIARYLIEEQKLHTTVKLNPTLNGPAELRHILNEKLKFKNVVIPDIAFEHDLKYDDGVRILHNLRKAAEKSGVEFSVKLTNTLESMNNKDKFAKSNEMMYMSGRALHALALNIACKLQREFKGTLDISFSSGVDAFNIASVLSMNIKPVTVCTDLLKPGGYERLAQYFVNIKNKMQTMGAKKLADMPLLYAGKSLIEEAILENLPRYLQEVLNDKRYHKPSFPYENIKTTRPLAKFDCIKAPCESTCPTGQHVPTYMYLTAQGQWEKALQVIRESNPFPNTTGMACDHICEDKCTRMNYDNTLLIRDIKRYVASKEKEFKLKNWQAKRDLHKKVAIIGGGPSGLSAAFYLALEGFKVDVYERKDSVGGMITYALPNFRTYADRVSLDIDRIRALGVNIHENHPVTSREEFKRIHETHDYVYVSIGASRAKKMGLPGEDGEGVCHFLQFLEEVKLKERTSLPARVAIVGGGNSAIDAARSALRLLPSGGELVMIYRRSIEDMPASREEMHELISEGITVLEYTQPTKIHRHADGRLRAVECVKMQKDATSGKLQEIVGSSHLLELDFLVPAIGQEINLEGIDLSLPRVFSGGDVARGPSSIIKGIADGKEAAYKMMELEGIERDPDLVFKKDIDKVQLKLKKAQRQYGQSLPRTEIKTHPGL